jgi:hypothetical protein
MPEDVNEHVDFSEQGQTRGTPICFSTYQRELNKLYMISSPAIKRVYSAQQAAEPGQAREYYSLIEEVTRRLWQWRSELPACLSLDLSHDCPATLDLRDKAHYLQSLSLHLTFDSLLIILHRPFLKRHLNILHRHGLSGDNGLGLSSLSNPEASDPVRTLSHSRASSEDVLEPANDNSQQQWWNAAVRTSKVIELPQLAQFASDGHLVAFMAINLFNAAIVMVVLTLSDPLTNRAQDAKRAIARIYRLQATLGARSRLSKQSSSILRNLVSLMMRRESDAILAPVVPKNARPSRSTGTNQPSAGPQILSVRETLSMPLGAQLNTDADAPQSWDVDASHFASRLDDSLASVQKGTCSSCDGNVPKTDRKSQLSPYSPTPITHCPLMGLSLHHMLKICTAQTMQTKAVRSGNLLTCQTTKAVFPLQGANGVPGHQTHVRDYTGSGTQVGIRCTTISRTGLEFVDPTHWSRFCRGPSGFNHTCPSSVQNSAATRKRSLVLQHSQ